MEIRKVLSSIEIGGPSGPSVVMPTSLVFFGTEIAFQGDATCKK